jgi:hypothetical protein
MRLSTRIRCLYHDLLHLTGLVRYHDVTYIIEPKDKNQLIEIEVSCTSGIGPFRSTVRRRAYREKPTFFCRGTGFIWVDSGKYTPSTILERIEDAASFRTAHQRAALALQQAHMEAAATGDFPKPARQD